MDSQDRDVLDPILNLSLPSPATSICFVPGHKTENEAPFTTGRDESGDSSDSDEEELNFRSSHFERNGTRVHRYPRQHNFQNRWLVSCHQNGQALLWNCGRPSIGSTLCLNRGGPGLAVRRIDNHASFLFQTRDSKGTVSIEDLGRHNSGNSAPGCSVVRKYETCSATFCQAVPCRGDPHLVALPSMEESTATIMDDRDPNPVLVISNAGHGMLTSLALSSQRTGAPILACGMEDGSVLFHDMATHGSKGAEKQLTKDPILTLDLVPSETSPASSTSSTIAAVGMAGDTIEVAELPKPEQGRVAILKVSHSSSSGDWKVRERARLSTCTIAGIGDESASMLPSFGKPGVSCCRFRPGDARVLAVGGWDRRVRLFDRSNGNSLGILRGHGGSVNALDWAPDATESGLIATAGSDDSRVYLWQCFAQQ